jgi:hypothetical protein
MRQATTLVQTSPRRAHRAPIKKARCVDNTKAEANAAVAATDYLSDPSDKPQVSN